nr:hypothetical protein CFP56_75113 [Quercus suber]
MDRRCLVLRNAHVIRCCHQRLTCTAARAGCSLLPPDTRDRDDTNRKEFEDGGEWVRYGIGCRPRVRHWMAGWRFGDQVNFATSAAHELIARSRDFRRERQGAAVRLSIVVTAPDCCVMLAGYSTAKRIQPQIPTTSRPPLQMLDLNLDLSPVPA